MVENKGEAGKRLAAIAHLSARRQWQAETGIDWDLIPARPFWLGQRQLAMLVGQLLEGEKMALAVTERLRTELPTEADPFAWQVTDERRHVAVLERYRARIGDAGPVRSAMVIAFEAVMAWRGSPAALVLACNLLLEEEALGIYHSVQGAVGCPLLTAILNRLRADEHRHVLIGRAILPDLLRDLAEEERIAIFRWLRQTWFEIARAAASDHIGDLPILGAVSGREFDRRWSSREARLIEAGLVTAAQAEAA